MTPQLLKLVTNVMFCSVRYTETPPDVLHVRLRSPKVLGQSKQTDDIVFQID